MPDIRENQLPANQENMQNGRTKLDLLLAEAQKTIEGMSENFAGYCQKFSSLRGRLREQRFHLAVLGQFKRGKSTLVNALLGDNVLPTAVVPLTAIPTSISWGPGVAIHVSYQSGVVEKEDFSERPQDIPRFLNRLVTEEENPMNQLGIAGVEVFYSAPLLKKGVVIIDTPGVGSTYRHNTEVTLDFLPQCDAAIFVLSADPPITENEVCFLKEIHSHVGHVIYVLNKVDYLTEREKEQSVRFLQSTLRKSLELTEDVKIYCLSARKGLEAKQNQDHALLAESGVAELESDLIVFLVEKKAGILLQAVKTKGYAVLQDAIMQLGITIKSLQMPFFELEERRSELNRRLAEIEGQRLTSADLLEGDKRRTVEYLEQQAQLLRESAYAHLTEVVEDCFRRCPDRTPSEEEVQKAVAEAAPKFFASQLANVSAGFAGRVAETLKPHQQRAEELIDSVRRAAAELFRIPHHAPESKTAFVMKKLPYWVGEKWSTTFASLPPGLLDRFLPQAVQKERLRKRLDEQIQFLVMQNVENLRWATMQNLDAAFRGFSSDLSSGLKEVTDATLGAIDAAVKRREEQAESVEGELTRLLADKASLEEISEHLSK